MDYRIDYYSYIKGIFVSMLMGLFWHGISYLFIGAITLALVPFIAIPTIIGWGTRDMSKTIVFLYAFYIPFYFEGFDADSLFLVLFLSTTMAFLMGGFFGAMFEDYKPRKKSTYVIETPYYSSEAFQTSSYTKNRIASRNVLIALKIAVYFVLSLMMIIFVSYFIAVIIKINIGVVEFTSVVLTLESIFLALYSMFQREKG